MRRIIKALPMAIIVAALVSMAAAGCAATATATGTSPKPSGACPQSAGRQATAARNESLPTGSLPGLSAAFIKAVNSTDVRIVPASQTAHVTVTEQSAVAAVLAQMPKGASASAGDLVTLTNTQHPDGVLVWAIETTGPYGGPIGSPVLGPGPVVPRSGTGGAHHNPPPCPPGNNFRVDFVNASTGAWLEGVSGYSPGLQPGT